MMKLSLSSFYMDIRSLALFRILFGTYLLYDLYSRLSLGKYDLAWYTQEPADQSYLRANDTPHQAPLHKAWFYRGSVQFQTAMFAASILLATLYTTGWYCNAATKLLLFLMQVHQQSKTMFVSDGSDSFSRHLLLWSIFLPVEACWSVDAQRRRRLSSSQPSTFSGLACLALLTQVVFMYLGTVLFRTIDLPDWRRSAWLPPQLSAVYYAMTDAFASRDNALTRFILLGSSTTTTNVAQTMTMVATIVEFIVPLLCWFTWRQRHWGAVVLFGLHAGLLCCFNLPNWQIVGMVVQALWIPTNVWDYWLGSDSEERSPMEHHKKTDGDTVVDNIAKRKAKPSVSKLSPNPISLCFQLFFFGYMNYNWAGMRGWIPKHDNGDIGEGLRLSQYWVMYGTLSPKTAVTQLIGKTNHFMDSFDVYHYIKTGGDKIKPDPPSTIPHNMTDYYPSPRWERALSQWAQKDDLTGKRAEQFCRALCVLLNQEFETEWEEDPSRINSVALIYKTLHVLPPGSDFMYQEEKERRYSMPPIIHEINCQIPDQSIPSFSPTGDSVMEPQIKPPRD